MIKWLLVCMPAAIAASWFEVDPIVVFALSLAAIIPLVEVMGDATEQLAAKLGPTIGGLLNSSLNNAPELIIGIVALSHGLGSVVKASLTGSILVNLMIGLGLALIFGGLKFGEQKFDRHNLRIGGSMLMICIFCFVVPAVFEIGTPAGTRGLSIEISVILLVIYVLNVFITLVSGRKGESITPDEELDESNPPSPVWKSLSILAAAAVALAMVSDTLSESLGPTAKALGLSDTFSGIVLLGGVGGIGEVLSAVRFARSGRPSLVLSVTVGSTIQMVLLVAPLLVFGGLLLGQPMDLKFTSFEVVSIVLAVLITKELTKDGEANWMEGILLIATYAILAIGFYNLPDMTAAAAIVKP
ncbi:MAG: calcium/proton exchanger [Planctomycetota bacterium]|nr:calcium/proton exchanger [Pirellulales bacterium]RLS59219.1 MAG: calcium/proton exchanger [Planctomycetota bacterium]